jgi:hypothetical protein
MAYITAADLIVRVPADVYIRMFDRDGDGIADADVVESCIATADSKVKMRCYAAFGDDFDAIGGTVDEAIKAMTVAYAFIEAVMYNPLFTADDRGAFSGALKLADQFFDRLTKDNGNRVRTSAVGRAQPRGRVNNTLDENGVPTNPFTQAADRRTPRTGF